MGGVWALRSGASALPGQGKFGIPHLDDQALNNLVVGNLALDSLALHNLALDNGVLRDVALLRSDRDRIVPRQAPQHVDRGYGEHGVDHEHCG